MELLTITEVAQRLHLSRSKLYKMIETPTSELKPIRIGKSIRFTEEQIDAFVQQKIAGGAK
jgi:excisionase family DNA binding protein